MGVASIQHIPRIKENRKTPCLDGLGMANSIIDTRITEFTAELCSELLRCVKETSQKIEERIRKVQASVSTISNTEEMAVTQELPARNTASQ
jgi:hypothetical protein